MADSIDIDELACPVPLRDYPAIVLGHGGGGKLSAELVENLFLPAFRNDALAQLGDAAVLPPGSGRMAFTTDSFVVRPLFFPGGSIGDLAVHGTINDLAASGAQPRFLSAGFIIEEGFAVADLHRVVRRMGEAAAAAGVPIVAGDTKVVERGHGDGCYINTAGIGEVPDGVTIGPHLARPGDAVIISGTIADHGMAIMSVREGLEFESTIESDTAALHELVARMLDATHEVHVLRDPTRGGMASTLNEIAAASKVGIVLDETSLPIEPVTQAACDVLGLDPLFVANEGKIVAIVAADAAESLVAAMREHPLGRQAAVVGHVTGEHPGTVVARTAVGGRRVIAMQIGEQLPRIC
ncbi:MAG: hydrogenase expression/formation protein HypE [Planctomycetota bacterium]|nr:MAG: hydrogenase expression/formation protein HypE [Planctomycetota bacterium]